VKGWRHRRVSVTGSSTLEFTMPRRPDLFDTLAPAWSAHYDPEAPWSLLGEPLEDLLAALPSQALEIPMPPDIHLIGDRIAIGKGTRILPGAILEGPLWIGEDVLIRGGAYLRGGCWIGNGCIVGANTEVKRSILFEGAKAPHLNYVGDSILGRDVNLGAGTILSNFRHDGGEIRIPVAGGEPIATGRRKLGAILGDGCRTGCNTVLNPGAIVGRGTQLYTGVQLRAGLYPANSLVKLRQQIEVVAQR
jgi:bifunctional N-acetylglucosamine-1-phosphate-uridyltransferase/glucosamine-1-phosphate-acetyltransferase GlmU-like protein